MDEAWRHLRRPIGVRVAADTPGPIDPGQGIPGAPIRVLHGQQRRKIVLLRVARVQIVARQLKLPPQPPVPHHHLRVLSRQREELRPGPEPVERHLRQHHVFPPRNIPNPFHQQIN